MEILWWLVPSAVVTVCAMGWVAWVGREGRGEMDREVALARLAEAMEREHRRVRTAPERSRADRSTGIAVRPSRSGAPSRSAGRGG